jgi:membrane peptidoglycan carboxypeptidase
MADQPAKPTDTLSQSSQPTGGWHKPSDRWQASGAPTSVVPKQRVLALPPALPLEPPKTGQWHQPTPADTTYTASDVIEFTPRRDLPVNDRPEDLLLALETGVTAAAPLPAPVPEEPAPEEPAPIVEEPAETETVEKSLTELEAESAPLASELTALEDSQSVTTEPEPALQDSSLLALELADSQATPSVDEDDEQAFSMSELIALTSLSEKPPTVSVLPTTPAAEAGSESGVHDPEAYAREQLEKLNQTGGNVADTRLDAATDPEAYAKQMLAQLGSEGGSPAPVAAESPLVARFRETEAQVRVLRSHYQAGQITRDQLQEQLKSLMILDDDQVWWMMGVESDNWYRYENSQWIPAQSPVQSGAVIGDSMAMGGSPSLASQPADFSQISGTFGTPVPSDTAAFGFGDETRLPRQDTPIEDPNRTMVGTAGAYLNPVLSSGAETLPGMGVGVGVPAGATVANPAFDAYNPTPYTPGAGIPSPIAQPNPTDRVPDYNLNTPASSTYEDATRRQRQQTLRTLFTVALIGVGAVILLLACGLGFIYMQYSNMAGQFQSQVAALANYRPQFQTARVLDMNGGLIAELNSQQGGARTTVTLDKISPFMLDAVIALENERFYQDPGWDWIAIGRAFIQNLSSGQVESGASTITQQIAEQLILKQPTTTPELKLQELVIASEIAKQYDKNFILQLYLNEIFFGNQSYGVEAAAQFYFGHSANDLNLPESALLAGMIAAPSAYNPARVGGEDNATYAIRRDQTFQRMDAVINRMQQVGCIQFQHAPYLTKPFCVDASVIGQATVQKALVVSTEYKPREVKFKYPHFVQFVTAQIEQLFGSGEMYRRGFVIKTTLNPTVQDAAETALKQTMAQLISTGVTTGSVMVTDPRTGAIRAMVGSPDFNSTAIDGQVNGALTWQQPGSSIKPIVYTGALEGVPGTNGQLTYLTPASILWDVPTTFNTNPPYAPTNFDRQFRGPVALRYALQNSYNIPAIKAYQFIGDAKFKDVASRMGLSFPEGATFGLPTGIGATEVTLYGMMSAYGTLANNGSRVPMFTVDTITDSTGQPILLPERAGAAQAIQPQIAYLMQNILTDDTARGAAFGINGPLTVQGFAGLVGAKTGTTNESRDLWTMGFTHNTVVGVWLGRPDNAPTFVTDGGYGSAAPLFNRVMAVALGTQPRPDPFTNPGGVVQQQICADFGTLPPANCRGMRSEFFLQAQPPPGADQAFVQQVQVDTWTGLRANANCPDNQISGTFLNISDAAATAWLNSPAGASIAAQWGVTANTIQNMPQATCDQNTEVPIARIITPTDNQTASGLVQINGSATATTFNRYQLEVASAASPNAFTIISGPSTTPQTSGLLGQWNTSALPNGTYILRLAMFATNGGYLYRTVQVNIVNTAPTPIPQVVFPTVTPASFDFTAVTPIPFDESVTPGP